MTLAVCVAAFFGGRKGGCAPPFLLIIKKDSIVKNKTPARTRTIRYSRDGRVGYGRWVGSVGGVWYMGYSRWVQQVGRVGGAMQHSMGSDSEFAWAAQSGLDRAGHSVDNRPGQGGLGVVGMRKAPGKRVGSTSGARTGQA